LKDCRLFTGRNEIEDMKTLLDFIYEEVGEAPCSNDPDGYHPENGASVRLQKQVCEGCPAKALCAEYAIKYSMSGIWGGTDAWTRAAIRKQRGRRGRGRPSLAA
jgi:WhiB family redox-sensing transcriptional regulator